VTIAFFDIRPDEEAFYRSALTGHTLIMEAGNLSADALGQAQEAEILSVHSSSPVTAEVMDRMPSLKHIACRTTGLDHVDLAYAKKRHIAISTVPAYGVATVAEYAFMLLLALVRRLPEAQAAAKSGRVEAPALMGHDLEGKTLGIIGAGRIGQHAARIARGFGLTVLAYDKFPNETAAKDNGYVYAPLEEVLQRSDYLTLHAPGTPETHHVLRAETLANTKQGVFIVNTGRGALIDTPALLEALTSGQVAGVALDVVEGEEYLKLDSELAALHQKDPGAAADQIAALDALSKVPNVIITTHNAYNTAEALERIRRVTSANILAWVNGRPQNIV
jgi:D-lactate dehydrogenase